MQSSVLYCEKANNYLNIKGKKLDIYFWIALIVIQRSLRTEFAHMFFLSLLQAKGAFLRPARDVVEYGCGLPYRLSSPARKAVVCEHIPKNGGNYQYQLTLHCSIALTNRTRYIMVGLSEQWLPTWQMWVQICMRWVILVVIPPDGQLVQITKCERTSCQ
jgi:hypothetical protein